VREQLGLELHGTQSEGRYVIVDVEQKTRRPVERLAWFDPPSNPGSTLLMRRQPDDVWRLDYQLRDDEDPVEAVKPDNVLPRVQSHLSMIGRRLRQRRGAAGRTGAGSLSMTCLALMARCERAEDVLALIANIEARCAAEAGHGH
jgi:hypothetical protein